jgi:ATP-dependent RNA helicase SUPV3L1/SUV3
MNELFYTKKEICIIFKIELDILENYIKKFNIKNSSKKRNNSRGFSYTYDIVKLSKDDNFLYLLTKDVIDDLNNILTDYVYKLDMNDKSHSEVKEIKKYSNNKRTELKKLLLEKFFPEVAIEKAIKLELINKKKLLIEELSESYSAIFNQNLYNKESKKIKYILHVGDTNSGKTYNAIKLLKENSGVYLAPLRLLAWEVYETLNNDSEPKICSLITGEEIIKHDSSVIDSCTVEMFNSEKYHNTIVLDECFMLNDKDRGKSWLKTIINARCETIHLITNKETKNMILNILKSLDRKNIEVNEYEKLVPLEINPRIKFSKPPKKSLLIVFSRISVLKEKYIYEKKGYNVSVLYGNLPPEVKKKEIEKFNSNITDICITTDVVGMGLNLPCENVIFLEMSKFDGVYNRLLNNIEIKQISGRAGRYGLYDKGYVTGINKKMIETALNSFDEVKYTYIGFDYNLVKNIEKYSMSDRIKLWKDTDFIPKELEKIILKEDINKYLNLINHNIIELEKVDKDLAWSLLFVPVKENNKDYFNIICNSIKNNKKISPPNLNNIGIVDTNSLKLVEDRLSELDIYNFIVNNNKINKFINIDDSNTDILNKKYKLIESINKFLLDKSLSNKKRCKTCGNNVGIQWVHKECNSCYEKRMDSYYYDDDWDWK